MHDKGARYIKITRRVARIWGGIIIALVALIAVMEIFGSSDLELDPYPWWENLMPLSILISAIGLAIAYRREGLGGAIAVTFVFVNLGLYLLTGREAVMMVVMIMLPIVIPGVLYLVCWKLEKRGSEPAITV